MTNLFAYTAPGADYPGYVSINRTKDGDVEVTVRGEPAVGDKGYLEPGAVVAYTVPADAWPADWKVQ